MTQVLPLALFSLCFSADLIQVSPSVATLPATSSQVHFTQDAHIASDRGSVSTVQSASSTTQIPLVSHTQSQNSPSTSFVTSNASAEELSGFSALRWFVGPQYASSVGAPEESSKEKPELPADPIIGINFHAMQQAVRGSRKFDLVQGDIAVRDAQSLGQADERLPAGGVCTTCDLWPVQSDGTYAIPYEIDRGAFDGNEIALLEKSMSIIAAATNVRWIPRRKGEIDFVRFVDLQDGCWSYVGRRGGMQEISLQRIAYTNNGVDTCVTQGTVLHEMLHAIGIGHEHQRPDRGDHLTLYISNVASSLRPQVITDPSLDDGKYSPFDFASIMLYARTAFSMNGMPVLQPKSKARNLIDLMDSDKVVPSSCDWTEVNKLYPGNVKAGNCVPNEMPWGCRPTSSNHAMDRWEQCRYKCVRGLLSNSCELLSVDLVAKSIGKTSNPIGPDDSASLQTMTMSTVTVILTSVLLCLAP